jgi:hypothetical protein
VDLGGQGRALDLLSLSLSPPLAVGFALRAKLWIVEDRGEFLILTCSLSLSLSLSLALSLCLFLFLSH